MFSLWNFISFFLTMMPPPRLHRLTGRFYMLRYRLSASTLLTCECSYHTIATYSPASACLLYKKTCLLFSYELPEYSEISRKSIKEVDRPCSFTDSVQKNSLWNANCSIFIAIKQVVEAFSCSLHVFLLRQCYLYEHLHSEKALCLTLYLPDTLKEDTRYLYYF